MVFFTCNACGEALKKNKVDKHLSQCRSKSLSCMDCGKDFIGNAYNSHNECVSEDQKYGGLDYKAKDSSQKGKLKQEVWIQKVNNAIKESNASKHIKDLMQKLIGFDNIPRKKPKFINFVKNCVKVRNDYYIEQMWSIFESVTKNDSNDSSNNSPNVANKEPQSTTNGRNKRQLSESEVNESNVAKKSKDVHNESESLNENQEECNGSTQNSTVDLSSETKQKLKMSKVIVEILKNYENNEMSLKKLRKKVLKVYKSNDNDYCKERIAAKFEEKINGHKKLTINEGRATLIKK